MGQDGFRVAPDELLRVAEEFERFGESISREAANYVRSAGPAPRTFGLLPESERAYQLYLDKTQQALLGLRGLQETLQVDIPSALRSTAGKYLTTDEAAAADFQ